MIIVPNDDETFAGNIRDKIITRIARSLYMADVLPGTCKDGIAFLMVDITVDVGLGRQRLFYRSCR